MAVIRNKGNYISNDRFGFNVNQLLGVYVIRSHLSIIYLEKWNKYLTFAA